MEIRVPSIETLISFLKDPTNDGFHPNATIDTMYIKDLATGKNIPLTPAEYRQLDKTLSERKRRTGKGCILF